MSYLYGLDKEGNVYGTFNWDGKYSEKYTWEKINMKTKTGEEIRLVSLVSSDTSGNYGSSGAD